MEKLDIILWAMGGGFAGTWMLIFYQFNLINKRIDKLSEKVEDIDRRLCRIEGSLSTHGHCLFSQEKPEKKAQ